MLYHKKPLERDQCMNIRAGDVVRVNEGSTLPADLMLISSSDISSRAYYSTAALDGESNLNEAKALKKTAKFTTPDQITQIRCYCEVQAPNAELSRFAGRAVFNYGVGEENEEIYPLTPEQLLLRGTVIKIDIDVVINMPLNFGGHFALLKHYFL